jgi:hypothetical protein
MATSGEKRWPPAGNFVATSGEKRMAIDSAARSRHPTGTQPRADDAPTHDS